MPTSLSSFIVAVIVTSPTLKHSTIIYLLILSTDLIFNIDSSEDEKEIEIHGIKYYVSSRYSTDKNGDTFKKKIEKYLGSDFTHLSPATNNDTMNKEYICLTAGKEVKCS